MVYRLVSDCGYPEFVAPLDYPCEPDVVAHSGATVLKHQEWTLESYLYLAREFPRATWMPILQGWTPQNYVLRTTKIKQRWKIAPLVHGDTVGICYWPSAHSRNVVRQDCIRTGLTICQLTFAQDGSKKICASEICTAHGSAAQVGTYKLHTSEDCFIEEGHSELRLVHGTRMPGWRLEGLCEPVRSQPLAVPSCWRGTRRPRLAEVAG